MYKKFCLGRQVKAFYSSTIEYVTMNKKSCLGRQLKANRRKRKLLEALKSSNQVVFFWI